MIAPGGNYCECTFHLRYPVEGIATRSSILAWRIPMGRGDWRATVHGVAQSDTTEGT